MTKLERIEVDGLKFDTRPGTSDCKAIAEVVERRSYSRHGFTPGEDEQWVDFGANVGAFSVWAASQHRSIQVEAFEPDPEMCELVARNAKINKLSKQITITQAAVVADNRKSVTLHCNTARGNVWRNSIERNWKGGTDIEVPTVHAKRILSGDKWLKMDIEGTEMPILEWLFTGVGNKYLPAGMVFEWSFDVDPTIARFHGVVEQLESAYELVKGTNLGKIDEMDAWPPAAFPPCRLVYAR